MMEARQWDGGPEVRKAAEASDKATGSTNKLTQAAAECKIKTENQRRDSGRK